MLKLENIKAIASTDMYANGRRLCVPGKIRKVQITDLDEGACKINGLVQGNFGFFHTAKLTLNSKYTNVVENYECNCYEYSRTKHVCRHCIALALAVAEDGEVDFGYKLKPGLKKRSVTVPRIRPRDTDYPEGAEKPNPIVEDLKKAQDSQINPDITEKENDLASQQDVHDTELLDRRTMEILLGYEISPEEQQDNQELLPIPLYWYPNDTTQVFHANTGIIGTMGTGKTQFTKAVITQLYQQQYNNYNGSPLGILVFDYKGDYNASRTDFMNATNARVLQPYHLPFNPLAIFESKRNKPLLPVHTGNIFKDTISRAFRLGPKQQAALYSCIMAAYEAVGIDPNQPQTWKKQAPTFDMVYDIYVQNDEIPKNDSLAAAMQKIHAFQLFEPRSYNTCPLFDILNGVVVIDLSGYDPDIQSLVVAITLDQFYAQMHSMGSSATDGTLRLLTKMIVVDEADNFMGEGYPSLKKIMKEGREFGVGTIVSTQFLEHFTCGEDDYSKYILTWIVHNVADLKKADVEYVFKTKREGSDTEEIYQKIKNFERFRSAVKIANGKVVYIKDNVFFELIREKE